MSEPGMNVAVQPTVALPIAAKAVERTFEGATGDPIRVLRGIDLEVERGETVSIVGPRGAGKSTLLSIMGAMNAPTSGTFVVDEIDIYSLGSEQQADFRREFLGFIFQDFCLVPYLTVFENVLLPLTIVRKSRKQKQQMVRSALSQVDLLDKIRRIYGVAEHMALSVLPRGVLAAEVSA